MFEAYKISVTLQLHNLISAELLRVGQDFKQAEVFSDSLRASLKATTLQANGLAAALKKVHAAQDVRFNAATAANESAAAFTRASAAAQKYTSDLAVMHRAAAAGVRVQPIYLPPALPAAAAGYPHGALSATGGGSIPPILAAPRLAGPAGMPYTPFTMRAPPGGGAVPPGGGGGAGGGAGGSGGAVYGAAPVGALLPLAAAAGTIYGAKALYESARDYETARTRFKTLNLGEAANTQADLFARRTQVTGVSSIQLMETLRESVGLFGSLPNAMKVAPMVAQLNAANSNLFGGKIGAIDETAVRAIYRFNDIRGLTNSPEDFAKGLDVAQRMVTGSGGAIQFKDLEQFAKRGGVAFRSMSDEGLMMYASVLQEKGGNAAGTGMMSMYQNLNAGRITKKAMSALEASGLVTLGTVDTGTVGGKKSTSTVIKSIVDSDLLQTNQGGWIIKNAIPAAQRLGDKTDAQIASRINSWLSNRTGADNAVSFGVQHLQVLRDRNMTNNAAGYAQTIALQQKTLGGNQGEFMAAWTNFKTEFGMSALPAFSKLLTNGSSFLREVNIFMESPAVKSFASVYQRGFDMQGSAFSKTANTLFGEKPGAQEVRTGAAVAGNDTGGGAFTGYRSPIKTSNAGAGRGMLNATVNIDGREAFKAIVPYMNKELQRPQTGPRTLDGRQSLRAFDTERGG